MIADGLAQLYAQGATVEEAAAIVAAIERFRGELAAGVAAASAPADAATADRWLRSGRLEAAGYGAEQPSAWGDRHPWGARA